MGSSRRTDQPAMMLDDGAAGGGGRPVGDRVDQFGVDMGGRCWVKIRLGVCEARPCQPWP
jgi:hypothetical protein